MGVADRASELIVTKKNILKNSNSERYSTVDYYHANPNLPVSRKILFLLEHPLRNTTAIPHEWLQHSHYPRRGRRHHHRRRKEHGPDGRCLCWLCFWGSYRGSLLSSSFNDRK